MLHASYSNANKLQRKVLYVIAPSEEIAPRDNKFLNSSNLFRLKWYGKQKEVSVKQTYTFKPNSNLGQELFLSFNVKQSCLLVRYNHFQNKFSIEP